MNDLEQLIHFEHLLWNEEDNPLLIERYKKEIKKYKEKIKLKMYPEPHGYRLKELEQQIIELQNDNRQLRFRLADEQDCNQHGECYNKIKELETLIKSLKTENTSEHQIVQRLRDRNKEIEEEIEYHHNQGCGYSTVNYLIPLSDELQAILGEKHD